jgi:hypothetical protein
MIVVVNSPSKRLGLVQSGTLGKDGLIEALFGRFKS